MHEARRVCGRESTTCLKKHLDDLAPAAAGAVHPRAQVLSLDALHGDEDEPLALSDLEHLHDVRVRELGHRARLSLQPRASLAVVARALDQLERDDAIEFGVAGRVDDPHAAGPELALQLVATHALGERRLAEQPLAQPLAREVRERSAA